MKCINLRKQFSYIISFISAWLPGYGWGIRLRGRLFKLLIHRSGKNLKVASYATIYNPYRLVVGDNVYIGHGSYIGDGDITLDNEVVLGPYCTITGGNHKFKNGSVRFGGYEYKPVYIGKGTWIGAHATVLAGVKVGAGCIVAAGSVVSKDVEDFMVVGGVPAKVLSNNNPESGADCKNQCGMKK